MYNTNNVKNNGQKKTRLTEMGVEVIDDVDESVPDEKNDRNDKSRAKTEEKAQEKQSILSEGDAPADVHLLTKERKRGNKKRALIGVCVITLLTGLLVGVGYLWLSGVPGNKTINKVSSSGTSHASSGRNEAQAQVVTAGEIAKELQRKPDPANDSAVAAPSSSDKPVTDRLPNEDLTATIDGKSESVNGTTSQPVTGSSNHDSSGNQASGVVGATSSSDLGYKVERSIRVSLLQAVKEEEKNHETSLSTQSRAKNENTDQVTSNTTTKTKETVPLPPFGTMLPVKTLSTIFTLRADSLVRLEVTRDISGNGWSLKRGTLIYGSLRGAEFETGRALISVVGFIDPNTNGFVRFQGGVLGDDGADGVRGRKHKLNSGWTNALKKVGAEAFDTVKSVASGIGGRPIVITGSYGSSKVIAPIADEITGLGTGRNNERGFVEVPAGTACYVMVTALPDEIQGVNAGVTPDDLQQLFDLDKSRVSGQLSEEELARLLIGGSREEIRRALPRVTPAMRRVAENYLANK